MTVLLLIIVVLLPAGRLAPMAPRQQNALR